MSIPISIYIIFLLGGLLLFALYGWSETARVARERLAEISRLREEVRKAKQAANVPEVRTYTGSYSIANAMVTPGCKGRRRVESRRPARLRRWN